MDLVSENLKLRALHQGDVEALTNLCGNKKIWDNVRDALPHPYTQEDAVNFIEKVNSENPQTTFAIDYKNELVGCIGLIPQTDVYRLSAEMGYWVGEPYWGFGIATEAVKLLVEYGFENLGLVRIYAGCFDFNKASEKVLIKAGFVKEGVSRDAIFKNGVIADEIRYALTKAANTQNK